MSDNFSITWEHPNDAAKAWFLDSLREPISPLEYAILPSIVMAGLSRAAQFYDLQFVNPEFRRINTYLYQTQFHLAGAPEASNQLFTSKLGTCLERLQSIWEDDFLPEIISNIRIWQTTDLRQMSLEQLSKHFDTTLATSQRMYELHFRIIWPAMLAVSEFEELYQVLFAPTDPFAVHCLLQGFPNKTIESAQALWELSCEARSDSTIYAIMLDASVTEIWAALERSTVGRAFLDRIKQYLRQYGSRGDKFGLSSPTLLEDPTPLISELKRYVEQPNRKSPAEQTAILNREREEWVQRARALLHGYSAEVVDRFELLLGAAQAGVIIKEDHEFYIDSAWICEVRRVLIECGHRLCNSNALDRTNQVFLLTEQELRATVFTSSPRDQRPIAHVRLTEMQHFAAIEPPNVLGSVVKHEQSVDILQRSFAKIFGGNQQQEAQPSVLLGLAASRGKARGPARIIRSLRDTARIRAGDVLVTINAAPALTPFFAVVAAVVTDVGGVLSHCALIAREYGIPAVVSTAGATTWITEGQLVEVDGTNGTVVLLNCQATGDI